MRAWRVAALAAAVATLTSACVSLDTVEMSRPAVGPEGETQPWLDAPRVRLTAYARHDRIVSSLVGPGLIVPLPIIPLSPPAKDPGRHFWIDVGVDPEGEEFSLDVRRIRLHLPDRPPLAASAFVGPVMYDLYRTGQIAICHAYREIERAPAVVAMTELGCVSLRFDVTPPPTDARFSLGVDGLSNRGNLLAPVLIPFEQRRFRRLIWAP
ncbi:MAG TPA: hypothetical protein VLG10_02825 [Methylomirabilota bacterium]|nr:hypothetical protein [Methylomirabilota bacterium]